MEFFFETRDAVMFKGEGKGEGEERDEGDGYVNLRPSRFNKCINRLLF